VQLLRNKGENLFSRGDFSARFAYTTGYKASIKERRMDGASSAISASISLEELEAQITELAGHLNAANYR
jgi:hypothetical protein